MAGGYEIGISGSASSAAELTQQVGAGDVTVNAGGSEISRTFIIVAGAAVALLGLTLLVLFWRR